MKLRSRWSRLALIATLLILSQGCRRERAAVAHDALTISVEQQSAWVRHFNPFSPNARRFTRAGIYEPLMIRNSISGVMTPWLATSYRWEASYTRLLFTLREDVRFSDGVPLTVRDVIFTFRLLLEMD